MIHITPTLGAPQLEEIVTDVIDKHQQEKLTDG
jgi:hypothetical protein